MSTEQDIINNEQESNGLEPETSAQFTEEVNKAESNLKNLEQQVSDLNDKYLRLYAEYDNFRKRSTRERAEYLKTAGEDIIKALLPIVDDFERAIKANQGVTDIAAVNEGIQLIHSKMQNAFKQKGVEPMDSVGKDFDPETMEAITNSPAPTPELKGKVIDELEKGFSLNGKVIRFAKVIVGS